MSQAKIKINGVAGSNNDLPINTLVQLDNVNAGGEATYGWQILDQPEGAADALSATNIQNPTFTPKKEGTYLIQLTVNAGLVDQKIDTQLAAVRQLKSRIRVPAAGETVQDDLIRGWASAVNRDLQLLDSLRGDGQAMAGVSSMALQAGQVCLPLGTSTIKAGLPGEEKLPTWARFTDVSQAPRTLFLFMGGVDGNPSPANGAIALARPIGPIYGVAGAPAVGSLVFVDPATGQLSLTAPGRRVGTVFRTGAGTYDVWFDGTTGWDKPGLLVFGADQNAADAVLRFLPPGYIVGANPGTTEMLLAMPACVLRNLRVYAPGAPVGDSETVTMRVDGAPTNIQAVLAAAANFATDLSGAHYGIVPLSHGVSCSIQGGGAIAAGAGQLVATCEYTLL